ncbi:PKD domain-containing protein [Flavitalea sp. BT771]|uniref:PKD domain-containing protein n=1 Tax=Flavitalea sp. BT771 TaxID=3063329 RepID=UPI0026E13C6A|nr:PKD domain-containing protein [Flavitalea sp. BT771]MDO6432997.1 PKD domain-containing protein [Flavitalea sp. BT771]MDV6221727.1 PKD domain-containing protein [Flavitalea sp. BT771]
MTRPYSLLLCFIPLLLSLSVSGQLHADFTGDKTGGCRPLIVHFSNQTTGASSNAVYLWDFGNGNTASLASPEAVYVDEGNYTVILTVKDGTNSVTATHTVTVYQPPAVDFSTSSGSACVSTSVPFSSASTAGSGSISAYLWDFGDGVVQQGSEVQPHIYQHAGDATVSLTVTNSNGCSSILTKTGIVKILPSVTAAFTTDKKVLCNVSDPVQFTNTSTGAGALTYLWDFGDGHTSTQADPSYSFWQKGTYSVKLTATSGDGCSATVTQADYLNVANYKTDFDLPATGCQGATLTLSDKSLPSPDSRAWELVGGSTGTAPVFDASFPSPGIYTVKLTDAFGACSQTLSKQITIGTAPALTDFDVDVQGKCGAPAAVNFTDHTAGAVAWDWNFNYDPSDPFPTIVHQGPSVSNQFYTNYRVYTVQLTVTGANGCSASMTKQVSVKPPVVYIDEPVGAPESSCNAPITKTYEIQHLELLQSWTWDFGDGTTSTAPTPTHTFSAIGQYIIVLNYVTKDGCTGVSNALYTIVARPLNLDFTIPSTTVCANTNLLFESPSLYASDALWSSWEFGDGSISSFYPQHVYTTPGVYTVTLHAQNAACQTTVEKTGYITVLPPVGAYTGFSNTCDGERNVVTFHFTPGGATTSLLWDFGDGNTARSDGTVSQLTHTYADNGVYFMSVSGGNGTCNISGSDQVDIFKKQHPVLTADQAAICPDGTLAVSVSNYDINPWTGISSSNYSARFQYGDNRDFQGTATPDYFQWGNVYSGKLTHFEGGESGLRLITTSVHFGCADTTNIVPLTIKGAAAGYEIIADDACFQSPVVLQDTSKVSAGNSIQSWLWDFGDGQTSAQGGTVSHNYAEPGNYTVKLTVQDGSGCSATTPTAIAQVTVNGPKASFTPSGTTVPLNSTVSFSNTTNSFGSNPDWTWDFGDGGTSAADASPSHTYTQAGTYSVTLTAKDPVTGCSSTATATIVVDPFGASFSASASYVAQGHCPPLLVQFTNHSVNYTSIHWDFGDGTTADELNTPSHVYEKAGEYTVTLTVSGANGLSGQYIQQVTVDQPTAALTAAATAICSGQQAQLKATAVSAVEYTWDFGDGSVASGTDASITHVYTGGGAYQLKLLVTDVDGCTASADAGISLQVHPPPVVSVTPAAAFVCLNSSVTLTASGGQTYSWLPVLGLDRADIAAPVASPAVNTDYQVTVTDDIGCQNTGHVAVEVIQPLSLTVTPVTASLCPGKSVPLHASGAYSYSWIDNTNGLSNTQSAEVVARPDRSGVYTVTGTDAHSCFSDTAEVNITILPVPTVIAGPDVEVLAGASVTLNANAGSDVTWTWSPAQYLSCADCAAPVCTPKKTMQYIATGTNGEGCSASDTVVVKLACDAAHVGVPSGFTPNGDGHNDRFVIQGIAEVDHLVIYGRWGQKVFERSHFIASDPSNCWDGTIQGQPCPTGVYTYFIEMRCPAGGVFSMKGTVVVVR